MRRISKVSAVAVGLLAVIVLSSSAYANDVLVGRFTLTQPTQWDRTVLGPGDYTFRMARTETSTDVLLIHGAHQTFDLTVSPAWACDNCRSASLNIAVRGDDRVVTSLNLPGFRVNFDAQKSAREREKQLAKGRGASEQIAIQVEPN